MNHLPFSLGDLDLNLVETFAAQLTGVKKRKIAVVVQGGGQRGIFTAGVFDAFLEAGFDPFELYIGTSAGALNLSSYISRQHKFGHDFITNLTTQNEFFNLYQYLSQQKPMNLDWAFSQIEQDGHTPLDIATARRVLTYRQALACATRKDTLQDIYLPMYQENWRDVLRATCAIPLLYNLPVNLHDLEWVDGGVSAAVPVQEAWKRGAELVIVIRTEPLQLPQQTPGVFDDWRERIEQALPEYIERFSLNESLDKVKAIRQDFTDHFELWKSIWRDKEQAGIQAADALNQELSEDKKAVNGYRKWLSGLNVERFLSLTGKRSEVLDMLNKYYQSYKADNEFLIHPPESLKVIQLAPEKNLQSKALLSSRQDLDLDYQQGRQVGREFLECFADLLNRHTSVR
ncbi:patatin family protein [Photobacterium sp. CCB-ST2H9]|uniref:patatin-like phospholipase family protein n=1 Tax=Photobacterium sp. CCB-ST2H9 TaxID=2912855 RepID=UPI00200607F9|nr:patatin-like phospholipase family protein [Photobacterium sp. CCB-ST2H9]UTM58671.1 patatin family protein [Photobacterium sp. CCB-ST2H9]